MLWFRIASVTNISIVLAWSAGICGGIIQMCQEGAEMESMIEDPTRNGTITVYVGLCFCEVIVALLSLFGLFIAFQMWRNNYQIDHSIRQQFIFWLAFSAVFALLCLCCGVYMMIRGRDNQENMARLYDSFQRYSQDTPFVSTFEKYQRENQCCGIYTPDDWLMLQLRQMPVAGGGGGGYQSLDYGFRQNPSTGKCHMQPPTIPPGCGTKMMEEINYKLKVYAALSLLEVLLIMSSCGFASYCFFYWLEKEVIVIPEDEVSNVVIIEPESGSTIILSPEAVSLSTSRYLTQSGYLKSVLPSGRYGLMGGSRYLTSNGSQVIHMTHTEVLRDQERALEHEFGGHVLAEMHVDHKSTKMLKPEGSTAHHATVALVRNKHPPEKKDIFSAKGHHGQTGNLAQDIADMSGKAAKDFIEDVYIPPGTSQVIEIPIDHSLRESRNNSPRPSFSNTAVHGAEAQGLIEGLIQPPHKSKHIHTSQHGGHDHHEHDHHHPHHHHGSQVVGSRSHNGHRGSYLAHGGHHHEHHGSYLEHGGHHHEHRGSYLDHGAHHHGSRYLGSTYGSQYVGSHVHHGSHHHGSHHIGSHHHGSRYLGSHENHHHHHHGSNHNGSHHHHHGHEHHGSNHHGHNHHHHIGSHAGHSHHHPHHNNHHEHGHPHHDHHHPHHHGHHGSRDLSRTTTVLFRNPRPMERD